MFLECGGTIVVPKTTENEIVFPVAPLALKIIVNKKDFQNASPRIDEQKIMASLEKIKQTCNNFTELKNYRLAFFFSLGFTCFLTLISLLLVQKGTRQSKDDTEIELLKFINRYFIAAFGLEVIAFFQNTLVSIILACKAKRMRLEYEEKLYPVISQLNEELKTQDVRWKLGKNLRWVEISLDYKKKNMMAKHFKEETKHKDEPHPKDETQLVNIV
mmetsp:Transcript_32100/g.37041  ORF Transcript_32100/g.37041 Transcript_32100/m.37041 type:complete len:216 (-) Transcript_32100:92-739(-)